MTVFVLLLAPAPGMAAGRTGTVCVAGEGGEGLERETVGNALGVERRKRAASVTVQLLGDQPGCTQDECTQPCVKLSLGPGPRAALVDAVHRELRFDLTELVPAERAAVLASAAIDALPPDAMPETTAPLVDVRQAVVLPRPPRHPLEEPLAGLLHLAAGYDRGLGQSPVREWVGGELAALLFAGRLGLGLAGAWVRPVEQTGNGLTASLSRGELVGLVRGGLHAGPALVQIGAGAGYEWRWSAVRSSLRFSEVEARSGAAVLLLEPSLLLPAGAHVVVGLAVPLRAYVGGESSSWQGELLFRAPRAVLGITARAGLMF